MGTPSGASALKPMKLIGPEEFDWKLYPSIVMVSPGSAQPALGQDEWTEAVNVWYIDATFRAAKVEGDFNIGFFIIVIHQFGVGQRPQDAGK